MSKKLTLNQDVLKKNHPWLERDYKKGETVYEYTDHTYGCITDSGIAVTEVEDEIPFFEVPIEAVS